MNYCLVCIYWCVWAYVCVCLCVYMHFVCACFYKCIYVCMCVHLCVYVCIVCVCMYMHLYAHVCAYVCVYICACMCVYYVHVCVYMCVCVCICIYVYMCGHGHVYNVSTGVHVSLYSCRRQRTTFGSLFSMVGPGTQIWAIRLLQVLLPTKLSCQLKCSLLNKNKVMFL